MGLRKAIFLDKDGTLIPDVPYNVNPELISLSADSIQGLQQFIQAGYRLIVISNQSGVAKGYFEETALLQVERKLDELLSLNGAQLSGFYFCPHFPGGKVKKYGKECSCRKPKPGLIERAAFENQIDLSKSWMIGDILNDIEAGNRAGCKTILIDNGNETEWQMNTIRTPDCITRNINSAAAYILEVSGYKPLV
jgi:D-glycero-D-manno-heptose 1,7-bisphosphate phosphatase